MDLYVQAFHSGGTHDLFYTDPTIIKAFKNYLSHVIPRYANNPAVLGWELGNDFAVHQPSRRLLPATQLSFLNGLPTFVSNLSDASSDQG
jgi:endo-1,4-beta-mannosidase